MAELGQLLGRRVSSSPARLTHFNEHYDVMEQARSTPGRKRGAILSWH